MILKAVANKYALLDMIVSEIVGTRRSDYDAPEDSQIEQLLMKCIADNNVKAYVRCNKHSGFVHTLADHQNIRTLWFYITEQCKQRLKTLEAVEAKTEGESIP
jgi:hypothetical protein